MAVGTLLLRNSISSSLTSLVQQALIKKPPFFVYDLCCESNQLKLHLLSPNNGENKKQTATANVDEGFESDTDTISLHSSEDGNAKNDSSDNIIRSRSRSHETDSANGSAASDSDDADTLVASFNPTSTTSSSVSFQENEGLDEVFNLIDCVCYTDVSTSDLLIFIIKNEVLVFKFQNDAYLNNFYKTFSTFKAISNQKTYGKPLEKTIKFNLLQRTDENGVMHIHVAEESQTESRLKIISKVFNKRTINHSEDLSNRTVFVPQQNYKSLNSNTIMRKVWNSAEDLLDSPNNRLEKHKKQMFRYSDSPKVTMSPIINNGTSKTNWTKLGFLSITNNLTLEKRNKIDSPKVTKAAVNIQKEKHSSVYFHKSATLNSKQVLQDNFFIAFEEDFKKKWINPAPTFFKKNRNVTPMAYRYLDTTTTTNTTNNTTTTTRQRGTNDSNHNFSKSVANRLFGMSSKLRDFSSVPYNMNSLERNSVDSLRDRSELNKNIIRKSSPEFSGNRYINNNESGKNKNLTLKMSLKSVIKKNDHNKKPTDKKVTFSAYTTVQVV